MLNGAEISVNIILNVFPQNYGDKVLDKPGSQR